MKAKLSSASGGKAGTPPKPSAGGQQGAKGPGGAAPGGTQAAQAANGPLQASGAAPADQRQSLPPLTPEEMRRQYAGARGARGRHGLETAAGGAAGRGDRPLEPAAPQQGSFVPAADGIPPPHLPACRAAAAAAGRAAAREAGAVCAQAAPLRLLL